jgi:transcriptional regulator NrdR family protein
MECPKCGGKRLKAVATNGHEKDRIIRKRRCSYCEHVFYTVELAAPGELMRWVRVDDWGQTKPTILAETRLVVEPKLET